MAKHGGGMTWQPVTYDPELNLIYVSTGNPQTRWRVYESHGRELFTASIVALNADTGKMAWYFQPSPHDTHDWDATQTPVLIDDVVNGQPRRLLAQRRATASSSCSSAPTAGPCSPPSTSRRTDRSAPMSVGSRSPIPRSVRRWRARW
jgi:PQQ enzyme repeat